jgi:hypothetical protein
MNYCNQFLKSVLDSGNFRVFSDSDDSANPADAEQRGALLPQQKLQMLL